MQILFGSFYSIANVCCCAFVSASWATHVNRKFGEIGRNLKSMHWISSRIKIQIKVDTLPDAGDRFEFGDEIVSGSWAKVV